MAAAAILHISNFKFLTIEMVKKDELRYCAKFCRNCSYRGGDVVII